MKNKKFKNKVVFAFVALGVIALGVAGFLFMNDQEPVEPTPPPVVESIGYAKDNDATEYLKALYSQIETAVENDDEETLKGLVASYFAADFFTWSNKETREDVGGLAYVLEDARIDFAKYATNYYYVNFDEHKLTYGQSGLPEVVNVTVNSVSKSDFVYAKTGNSNSFDVDITLEYETKAGMPTDELMKEFKVTLLLENDIYYVVGIDYQQITSEE